MNNKHQPLPQPPTQISVFDLANLRIGLAQITDPSEDIKTAISHLDSIILNFTSSLKGN